MVLCFLRILRHVCGLIPHGFLGKTRAGDRILRSDWDLLLVLPTFRVCNQLHYPATAAARFLTRDQISCSRPAIFRKAMWRPAANVGALRLLLLVVPYPAFCLSCLFFFFGIWMCWKGASESTMGDLDGARMWHRNIRLLVTLVR